MKKFIPQTGGHRLYNDDFQTINDGFFDCIKNICKSFIRSTDKPVRLNGLIRTYLPGNIGISAGSVFYNNEIFEVDAINITTSELNDLVLQISEEEIPGIDPIQYADGSSRNFVHVDRKLIWVVNTPGTGTETDTQFLYINLKERDVEDQYTVKDFYPPANQLNNLFDSNGLGIYLMEGWAICNGNNGTPDLRGQFTVMASQNINGTTLPGIAISNLAYGTRTGAKASTMTISKANLPNYNLTIIQLPHNHTYSYPTNKVVGKNAGSGENAAEYYITETRNTGNQSIDITVNTGGSGTPISIATISPAFAMVKIMKIR